MFEDQAPSSFVLKITHIWSWSRKIVRSLDVISVALLLMGSLGFGLSGYALYRLYDQGGEWRIGATEVQASAVGQVGSVGTESLMTASSSAKPASPQLVVDVSGAVENPGVYVLLEGSRLGQALDAAGGVTSQASLEYLHQTLNLALELQDSDKVYIPTQQEYQDGLVASSSTNLLPNAASASVADTSSDAVSINVASQAELEKLPGIGPKRAEDIIQNRPYQQLGDVVTAGALSQSLFDDLSSQLTL